MRLKLLFCLIVTTIALSACQGPSQKELLAKNHGMTWAANKTIGENTWVDCYSKSKDLASCNPYVGDTQCTEMRPVLCINKNGNLSQPDETQKLQKRYDRAWSGGEIKLTEPVRGTDLSAPEIGDGICAGAFGKDWKMAEFHDGDQWGFWAKGIINPGSRFWVAVNDQNGNCWNRRFPGVKP